MSRTDPRFYTRTYPSNFPSSAPQIKSDYFFAPNFQPEANQYTFITPKDSPTSVTMGRGQSGKQWKLTRLDYCFKVTIQDGHSITIDDITYDIDRLPIPYLAGLEIVSQSSEDGLAVYTYLDGAHGHGHHTYINVIDSGLGAILHEIGHAIETEISINANDTNFLSRWYNHIASDNITVSSYAYSKLRPEMDGIINVWEDVADFARVYAMALYYNGRGSYDIYLGKYYHIPLHVLKLLSPARFNE